MKTRFSTFNRIIALTCTAFVLSLACESSAQTNTGNNRLRDVVPPGFAVGGVIHGYDPLAWMFPQYLSVAEREFNAVTATCYMPWGGWPNPKFSPDTSGLDRVVDWATARGILVHGHALVYPEANLDSDWWMEQSASEVESRLRQFIRTMTLSRANKVWVWDVVNEALADDGELMDADGLRMAYKEYLALGPGYVDKAFQWARSGDPKAVLILNDYGIEELCPKSDRILAYALKLKAKRIPIGGIGFQMHCTNSLFEPNYKSIQANFQRFADAGFQIFITEMDATATNLSLPTQLPSDAELKQQGRIFQSIAKIAVDQPACKSLLMWDYADNYSWLHPSILHSPPLIRRGHYTFPTIYWGGMDQTMARKQSYFALHTGLKGIGARMPQPTVHTLKSALAPTTGSLLRTTAKGLPSNSIVCGRPESVANTQALSWRFEPVNNLIFRIRCQLGDESTYLTRTFPPAPISLGNTTYFSKLDTQARNQLWIVREVQGGVTIQSYLHADHGYLTRDSQTTKSPGSLEKVTALGTISFKAASKSVDQVWIKSP